MNTLSIGTLARESRVNIETIRFYERKGLLAKPPRNESGYRQFPAETLEQVRFIRKAKELGFTLKEIAQLLSLRIVPGASCAEVLKTAEVKLQEIDEKIIVLKGIQKALRNLTAACRIEGAGGECHFLELFSHQDDKKKKKG